MPRATDRARIANKSKSSNARKSELKNQSNEAKASAAQQPTQIPLQLQQKALNIFRDALDPSPDDKAILQDIKSHLFSRDFAAAFGKSEYLRVYASRWSPSRALGYLQVFTDIQAFLLSGSAKQHDEDMKVVSVGGGAGAELVGLGAWLHSLPAMADSRWRTSVYLLDIARWNEVAAALSHALVTAPQLSKYASVVAKEGNAAMLSSGTLDVNFFQQDALATDDSLVQALEGTHLVTLMFTLNELYSTSIPRTQQMLARLTSALEPGTHLLVVDSPGSYSTVTINGSEKKYPMQWLLDHTLLEPSQKGAHGAAQPRWEKLLADESRWFRMPTGLSYPIDLENMRYQIHLYRRLAG